ncbi:glutathione S-transferase family protein [Aliagarivorans marinus]|uniref:glutathione S-transferase family protein n=1 Tax=Aliagarivorans marinus TaxID=561965 RepID=UPI00041029DE|nr:glutathione S-transferase family protein [Aliagarivorans marinus]
MSLKPIELISFKLCPFVQRSVITLREKGIDYDITYIDLRNKPDWFLAISPLGKVPVLKYGDEVLFESAVINEFLDEVSPGSLLADEPFAKAIQRAWIEYASQVLMNQYMLGNASSADDYQSQLSAFEQKLAQLQQLLGEQAFFSGDALGLLDTSIIPVFTRLAVIKDKLSTDLLKGYPSLAAYSERVLVRESVAGSVVAEFPELFVEMLKGNGSYLVSAAV